MFRFCSICTVNSTPPDSVKVRRFPRPWRIEGNNAAFWVVDAEGKAFGYCYFDARRDGSHRFETLTRDEARRLVSNIAKLPDLLGQASS